MIPQAGRLWCVDCKPQSANLLQLQFHSSCLELSFMINQQAFHELLAAVVSSQWPRNTSEHLCISQIPEVLLSQEVKISSMLFASTLTLVLSPMPGFMPLLLVPSMPSSLLVINYQWLSESNVPGVSIIKICYLCCAFLRAMNKAHQFKGERRYMTAFLIAGVCRAQRKEQHKFHWQMTLFP